MKRKSLNLIYFLINKSNPTMHFNGSVILFFANNSLTEYRIAMEFLHNFFLYPEVFLVHIPCFKCFHKGVYCC